MLWGQARHNMQGNGPLPAVDALTETLSLSSLGRMPSLPMTYLAMDIYGSSTLALAPGQG